MGLGWMDVSDLSFNSLLLLEEVQLSWLPKGNVPKRELGIALKANPVVEWYFRNKCVQLNDWIDSILENIDNKTINDPVEVRQSEIAVLEALNDWIVYVVDPLVYDQQSFLNWNSQELLSLVDFSEKTVIDVGAGTGRLTFVAAERAKTVYAVEPVGNLRSYLRKKAKENGFENVYAVDGLIEEIPFSNQFADITMGGHVFGEYPEKEYSELLRVTKPGGMIILCPGNNDEDNDIHDFLIREGFEWSKFEEPRDGMKRKYWKQVK